MTRVALAALVSVLLCLAALAVSSRSPIAQAADIGTLQQRISAGQGTVSSLAGAVSAASSHLAQLDSSIAALQGQLSRIQADLNAKRTELLKLRSQLEAARVRLARLEAYEAHAETVLAQELVSSYESDRPDLMHVVLDATGFQDLLERLSFMQRVQKHNSQVVSEVRAARRAVAAEATHLGALEVRQQQVTEQVLQQRNSLARTRVSLVRQQLAVAQIRRQKAGQLASARAGVADLQRQLSAAEAAQASASQSSNTGASGSAASSDSSGAPAATAPVSSGGFTFPLPKSAAAPPSEWSPDQGVDISAPGDTPEYAVCSGTIVLHGIGGFGPWAPVLHCDSPIDGYSYVYYGHAGPANQLPVGTHVGAGQVMSSIGPGIVGISTGPHLEIGFADSSGSPIGSQTAGTMLSLLQSAYGG